jgi:hypothetical protein
MRKNVSVSTAALSRHAVFVWVLAFFFLCSGIQASWSDSVSTGGNSAGNSDGSGSGSVISTSESGTSSSAISVGDDFAFGKTRTRSHSGFFQLGDEFSVIEVYTEAKARASSKGGTLKASASASQSGNSSAGASNGGVSASATSNLSGFSANANSSNGAYANATYWLNGGSIVSSFVPGGTTTKARNRAAIESLSVDIAGNYSYAISGPDMAQASVGVSTISDLSLANISSMLSSAMFAQATAGFDSVSAKARAEISASARGVASQARASGFSEAFASVTRKGSRFIVTVKTSSNVDPSCKPKIKGKIRTCIIAKKVVHVSGLLKKHHSFKVAYRHKKRH